MVEDIRYALYASKIVSYAQGYMLMRSAAKEYGWNLNYGGDCADVARGMHHPIEVFWGRSRMPTNPTPKLTNVLLDDYFRGEIKRCQKGWRNVVSQAVKRGIPVPAFSTALAFF
jgi:6-phosphogluconate dehydrogenase